MGLIKRVLNVEEIRKIWMACDVFRDGQTSYGSFIQMLFLTAQRRNEITLMQRDEIDLEKSCYTIPAWRNKGTRTHEMSLSPRAIRIITQRLDHEYDHIFPGARADFSIYDHQRGFKTHKYITLDQPMDSRSKLKIHLDELSGVTDWTQHDIRRTVGTSLAELGVPRLTISRVRYNQEGGVTSIYDRHSYFKEKLAALELWGRRFDQILTPDGGENIVPLKKRG